jgi:hypothetical protein
VVAPTTAIDQEKVAKFIKYHFLKKTVIANKKDQGGIETLLRNQNDEPVFVNALYDGTTLYFKDADPDPNRKIYLTAQYSNVLADRIVIHSINTYLK